MAALPEISHIEKDGVYALIIVNVDTNKSDEATNLLVSTSSVDHTYTAKELKCP